VNDPVEIQIVAMVLTTVGTIFTGIMAYLMAKLNADQKLRSEQAAAAVRKVARRAGRAAKRVEEVKQTLLDTTSVNYRKLGQLQKSIMSTAAASNVKLDDIAVMSNGTHKLVNSAMIVQLKISAMALRRVADLTEDPRDIEAAELAEQLLREQLVRQASVDALSLAPPAALVIDIPASPVEAP
jgi:hypothetical protein